MSVLAANDAIATVAVGDLKAAGLFYEGKLGFTRSPSDEKSVINFRTGRSTLIVYESDFAGTNKATAVTWIVDDGEEIVRQLTEKGVAFDHYDLPGVTRKGDVHYAGKLKNAWFKDPSGNILAVVSE